MNEVHDRIRLIPPMRLISYILSIPFVIGPIIIWGADACKGDANAIGIIAFMGLLMTILYLACRRIDQLASLFADDQHIYMTREGKLSIIDWSQVTFCHNIGGIPNTMILAYIQEKRVTHLRAVYCGKAKKLIKKNIERYGIKYSGRI